MLKYIPIILALFLAVPANAGPIQTINLPHTCGSRLVLLSMMKKDNIDQRASVASLSGGTIDSPPVGIYEVWTTKDRSLWVSMISITGQKSCIMSGGRSFMQIENEDPA